MNTSLSMLRLSVLALALGTAALAHATLVTAPYYSNDPSANGTVTAGPAAANAVFLGALNPNYLTEGFENSATTPLNSGTPISVFGKGSMSNGGGGDVTNNNDDGNGGSTGRFNTTSPCKQCAWWETTDSFTVAFGGNYNAFGFYGTDFADFGAIVYLDLIGTDGTTVVGSILVKDNSNVVPNTPNSGGLLHFGFTDNTNFYSGVTVRIQQTATSPAMYDVLGFDDLVVGNLASNGGGNVPEPATLALVGLSLVGVAASRRKKQN